MHKPIHSIQYKATMDIPDVMGLEYFASGDFFLENEDDIMKINTKSLYFKNDENCDKDKIQSETQRFGGNITADEIEKVTKDAIPAKTRNNNNFSMNVWRAIGQIIETQLVIQTVYH